MSEYRSRSRRQSGLGGRTSRMMRALISVREMVVETWRAHERVVARGRQSRDPNASDDGRFEGDNLVMEHCQPIGIVARPGENATIEAIVANVGADGANPYVVATIDHRRAAILDARGIDTSARDFVVLYNDTDIIEIRDGKIRLGSMEGSTEPLATKKDVDDLRAYVDHQMGTTGHTHAGLGTPPIAAAPPFNGSPIPGTNAPTANGTQRVEAE